MAARPSVTQELARVMAEEGCTHLFTLMGAGNLWLVDELARTHDVAVHHLRHENGVVGAADGYARAIGEVGWCTVTQGPGFTNTITAIVTAARAGTPLVMVVSDSSNLDPARFPFAAQVQALRPEDVLEPLGVDVVRLADGPDAASDLRTAVHRARNERRTVVVAMPAGLDKIEGKSQDALPRGAVRPVPTGADERYSEAADALEASARPVVVAGYGALLADAGGALRQLAEALDAPVVTTVHATGLLGGDAREIGHIGGFAVGAAERAILDADLLLVFGCSMNSFHTRKGALLAGKRVVRVDCDPVGSVTAADVIVRADARVAAEELARRVKIRARRGATFERGDDTADLSETGLLDPRAVSRELDRVLPRPRRVFIDNGHFGAFPAIHMRHTEPRSLVWMPEFGAVGSALGASFAGAVGDPATLSVLFIGDCGLYMTLGDLETAVRERAPLVVVAMNDGAAGSELVHMADWGAPPDQAIFGYADLAAVARGMGAVGVGIRDIADIEPAVRAWQPESGPLLLDCHVRRDVRSPIYAHV